VKILGQSYRKINSLRDILHLNTFVHKIMRWIN